MYDIIFFEDKNGKSEIEEYLLVSKKKQIKVIKMPELILIKLLHI